MKSSERINRIAEYLNISIKELSERCGYDRPQAFYDVQKGKTMNISPAMCSKIISVFPVFSKSWLLTGEGDMLNNDEASANEKQTDAHIVSHDYEGKIIRYWKNIDATASGITSFNDYHEDFVPLSIPEFKDCTDAVNVYGDSMYPLYKNGNIVILKEWTESFIEFGNVYLIITKNGYRMIKYIMPGHDEQHIECRSENPNFPPFQVPLADILHLYVVKGSIARNLL